MHDGGGAGEERPAILVEPPAAEPGPSDPAPGSPEPHQGAAATRAAWLVTAWVALTALTYGVYRFMKHQGAGLTGDAPHYLITARALTHLSPHVTWAYQHEARVHEFLNWPPPSTAASLMADQVFAGPHGVVSAHGLGLPIVLCPFVAVGGLLGGLLGFFGLTALGVVYLHQRASRLAGLGAAGQVLFAVVLAAPALWLAATQIYPDLPSGLLFAVAVLELVALERTGTIGTWRLVLLTACVAYEPWLHTQNVVGAVFVLAALVFLGVRSRIGTRRLVVAVAVVAVVWLALALYNEHYFGHLLGLPQPSPRLTTTGVADTLALLFDRHQGAFVQVPSLVVGLLGLWWARRRAAVSVVAALGVVVTILVLNGTYIADPFGGTVLAGRFQWTVLPVLLLWAPFALRPVERRVPRLAVVGAGFLVLWAAQAKELAQDSHVYFNAAIAPFAPWDPSLYPGWWPRINGFFPVFLPPRPLSLATTWVHLVGEVGLLVVGGLVVAAAGRPGPLVPVDTRSVGTAVVAGACAVSGAAFPGRSQPAAPLVWTGQDLGAPFQSGSAALETAPVALTALGTGRYTATLRYTLAGPAPARLEFLESPGLATVGTAALPGPTSVVGTTFSCPPGTLWVHFRVPAGDTVQVASLTLTKDG